MNKRGINRLLKWLFGGYLKRISNMSCTCEGMDDVTAPYVLLGNHTNFFDPFLVSRFLRDHVYFVASDEYFRNPLLRVLLKWVGAIPKAKFMSDSSAVREIIRLKEKKAAVGIYPEGTRSWDGLSAPVLYPTARLVKTLGIPVVTALTAGGYLSFPRWARIRRKGRMHLTIRRLLSAEEVAALSADEIHVKIGEALAHDDNQWQREQMIRFEGRKLAESLEVFLHTCPKCQTPDRLHSDNDLLTCAHCGYSVRYNAYGFFERSGEQSPEPVFDEVGAWSRWQREQLHRSVTDWMEAGASTPLMTQPGTQVFTGAWRRRNLVWKNRGTLRLEGGMLRFEGRRETLEFEPRYMTGLVVNHKNKVDFFYRGRKLYRLEFDDKNANGHRWVEALQLLKGRYRHEHRLDNRS